MAQDTSLELREVPSVVPPSQKNPPPPIPQPATIEEIANPLEHVAGLPSIETYKGDVNKMEVFNGGENGVDKAVKFQLKMGVQKDSFALSVDSKDASRVINLEDSRKIDSMSDKQLESTLLMQKQGDKLAVSKHNQSWEITQESLTENPVVIPLDDQTGIEIRDFDPAENSITIHKVKLNLVPAGIIPSPSTNAENGLIQPKDNRGWSQRLLDVIGVPAIAASAILAGQDNANYEQQPPAAPIERPLPADTPVGELQPLDESLRCEKVMEFEIKQGDFLTKALVDVNGVDRYLDANGQMDVNKLYKDLMCLLVIPQNIAQLEKTDPTVAQFIKGMLDQNTASLVGSANATRLYDGLAALNSPQGADRFPNASKQLVIVQAGNRFLVPKFEKAPHKPPEFPTPTPHLHPTMTPTAPGTPPEKDLIPNLTPHRISTPAPFPSPIRHTPPETTPHATPTNTPVVSPEISQGEV